MGILVSGLFGYIAIFKVEYFFPELLLLEALPCIVGEEKTLIFLFCRTKVMTWGGEMSKEKEC